MVARPILQRESFAIPQSQSASCRIASCLAHVLEALTKLWDDTVSCSTRRRVAIICCHWAASSPNTAAVRGQFVKSLL